MTLFTYMLFNNKLDESTVHVHERKTKFASTFNAPPDSWQSVEEKVLPSTLMQVLGAFSYSNDNVMF